ncbi:nucleotide disphospho-sugar-binding domain-containing protein [Nonomuraea thailandensis]
MRNLVIALAPLGGTVVLATGGTDPAALDPLPDNVIARRFVPQTEVLERAALFVTHGGMNSVNEAMYAGVPMLVIPQGADQPLVARRVVQLGAGLAISPATRVPGSCTPWPGGCSTSRASWPRRTAFRSRSARPAATCAPPTSSNATCAAAAGPPRPTRRGSGDPCRLS